MKAEPGSRVVVLGASPDESRYSNKAIKLLIEKGFDPVPVHPSANDIRGRASFSTLRGASEAGPIHTVSVYVNETISNQLIDSIIACRPKRVILNPGAENSKLERSAAVQGIEVVKACTLVLLRTDQF